MWAQKVSLSVERQKIREKREREVVECDIMLRQEKNLSRPQTGEQEIGRVPVSALQTAIGAEDQSFQKHLTFSKPKPLQCVLACWGRGPARDVVVISGAHWERTVHCLEYSGKRVPKNKSSTGTAILAGLSGATLELDPRGAQSFKTSGFES